MTKHPYTNRCNCPDSIALEKEVGVLKALLEQVNNGKPWYLDGKQMDNLLTLYPVGAAKYRKAMGENIEFKEELEHYKKLVKNRLGLTDITWKKDDSP